MWVTTVVWKPDYLFCGQPELIFPKCGHRNYGTLDKPASVQADCPICGKHYCESCNYDVHRCAGCGEDLTHRTEKKHFQTNCTE